MIAYAIYDMVGLAGLSLSVFCYAKAQIWPVFMRTVSYSALNLLSALLLGASLLHDWNLASFTSNIFWGMLSLYGLGRALKLRGSGRSGAELRKMQLREVRRDVIERG